MSPRWTSKVFLFLDGVSSCDLQLAIIDSEGRAIRERVVKDGVKTEKLLKSISDFLAQSKRALGGMVVAQGGGSFSQTRLVCAVVNAMAYGFGIPVAAVTSGRPPRELTHQFRAIRWLKLLKPDYRGPAVG